MLQKKDNKIKLANNNSVRFPVTNGQGNILIIGNFDGICGTLYQKEDGKKYDFGVFSEALKHNATILIKTLQAGKHIYLISTKETITYFNRLLTIFRDYGWLDCVGRDKAIRRQYHWQELDCTKDDKEIIDCVNNKLYNGLKEMKFENIIQNPPYNKSLHLDFLEKGLDLLTENGKMVIVEPSTWLINIRKNGKAKRYDALKERLNGHIQSVIIENLNNEFNTGLYVPFATTTIDMSKTFEFIDCMICGEHKIVDSIYDCNLIGKYSTIWSILEKTQKYGDMMNNHITKEDKGKNYCYAKYHELTTRGGLGITACVNGAGMILENAFNNDTYYTNGYNNDFYHCGFSTVANEISDKPLHSIQRGGAIGSHKTTNKIADNIFGTREEIENWKYFIFNNQLPLFINIVLTIDQHNNSKEFLPWLVDKQYSDNEINKIFNFTNEEIKLIEATIKKYNKSSPWFKRYMCGKDSVSNEEINNFMKEVMKQC